ncbi:MAG: chloride channel protein [Kiritimatiellae bacterium]|nr:chloride channel protein [Kiritimatiellia bacterium]
MSFRRLSVSGWKFFIAGKGFSFRTGKYFGESMLVGAATGFVVVAFRQLVDFGAKFITEGLGGHSRLTRLARSGDGLFSAEALLDPQRWAMLFLPAAGAVLGYLIIKRFSSVEHVRGTDSAIRAYHHRGGSVTGVVIPTKSVASVFTVASGGSAGYEGPVTLLGAAVGSWIARHLHLSVRARRILMTAGLAGGIGALFQAPLAGALFGMEIMYSSSDIAYETVLPCFISSAVSYTVFAYFYGWDSLFAMPPEYAFDSGLRLLPYFVLAIVVVFGVRFYIAAFRKIEMKFATMRLPRTAKIAVGGLATGAIGFFFPDVLSTGYPVIQECLTAGLSGALGCAPLTIAGFSCFFFLKAVATSFTVGSGGSGGVFAPALVCGGTLGAAVGLAFARLLPASVGIHPASFALVGMAGFLASAIRTPLTAIVMVAEISGNHELLVPAMWVCGISFWLNNGWTLYRSQVHNRDSALQSFLEAG